MQAEDDDLAHECINRETKRHRFTLELTVLRSIKFDRN
jgi:hypothetical protein